MEQDTNASFITNYLKNDLVYPWNWEAPCLWHYMQKSTGSPRRPLKVSNVESYFYFEFWEHASKQYRCLEFVVLSLVCFGVFLICDLGTPEKHPGKRRITELSWWIHFSWSLMIFLKLFLLCEASKSGRRDRQIQSAESL